MLNSSRTKVKGFEKKVDIPRTNRPRCSHALIRVQWTVDGKIPQDPKGIPRGVGEDPPPPPILSITLESIRLSGGEPPDPRLCNNRTPFHFLSMKTVGGHRRGPGKG